ncbi:MAG: FHA domain-containing protein [Cyanobacteriota bacterium]|nr:FHA domain-containing protein [Cyanobacteriota bacterium]
MSPEAQLLLRDAPHRVAALDRSRPTTIGRAEGNRLRLVSLAGVADHHAVVRFSRSQGWLVCDWQSGDGTFLEGQRLRQCRRLSDGDEIQLGPRGPVLVFRMVPVAAGTASPDALQAPPQAAAARPAVPRPAEAAPAVPRPAVPAGAASAADSAGHRPTVGAGPVPPAPTPVRPAAAPAAPLTLAGRTIPLDQIRSVQVRSRPRHPHSFSWWVLVCLGGMVLLPWPWLFWGVQLGALAAWIVLGSRKEHELLLTLRDGMAHRHGFANRITALSHRNGIRRAIGQSLEER